MTTKRMTARRDKAERNKAGIIAALVEGGRDADVAREFNISPPTVWSFRRRYATVIAQALAEVESRVEEYAIAQKVNRIAAKDRRWQLLEAVRQARAKGRSGEETGLVIRQYRKIGSGEDSETVIEFKIDDGLLAAMERAERSAAEELGQLPKQGDQFIFAGEQQQINFFDRSQTLALAQALLEANGLDKGTRVAGIERRRREREAGEQPGPSTG